MNKTNFLSSLSKDQLWKHVLFFNDLFRASATEDDYSAVAYVVKELENAGIETEVFEFPSLISYPISAEIELVGEHSLTIPCKTRAFSTSSLISGEGVYISTQMPGSGITDGLLGGQIFDNEFLPHIVNGKIILSQRGGPDAIKEAQDNGAIGFIHIWPSEEDVIHEMIVSPIWGTPDLTTMDQLVRIPVVSVRNKDGAILLEALKNPNTTIRLKTVTDTAWRNLKLPVATIKGNGKSDLFLLIGGHLDSWHEGITDNATGNASLIELAKLFQRNQEFLAHNVKVAWWPGHSYGRYSGSTWFADHQWQNLFAKAIGYINIDSPGCKGATDYSMMTASAEAEDIVKNSVRNQSNQLANIEPPTRCADQSFNGIGLSSLFLLMGYLPKTEQAAVGGSGGGWWWHSEEDTLDKADADVLLTDTKIYADSAYELVSSYKLPLNLLKTVEQLHERVRFYASRCSEFMFEKIMKEIEKLKSLLDKFYSLPAIETSLYNRLLLRSIKDLNSVLYSTQGRFKQDLATPTPLLPGLYPSLKLKELKDDMDLFGFTITTLIREENRILFAIRECIARIAHVVEKPDC